MMNCPKCQAPRSTTVKRKSRGDDDFRLRQCAVCGETWITREGRLTAIELWDELTWPLREAEFAIITPSWLAEEIGAEEFI